MLNVWVATRGDAFAEGHREREVTRLLRKVADRIEAGEREGKLLDLNGNRCGDWSLGDDD